MAADVQLMLVMLLNTDDRVVTAYRCMDSNYNPGCTSEEVGVHGITKYT